MKTLIVGYGEIGKALYKILIDYYEIRILDIGKSIEAFWYPEIIHICFPYSDIFISEVKRYQKKYKPKFTVIHSTVPVGTSRQCEAIHSPIIGQHPHLEQGIQTFPKMLSGEGASEVADYFRRIGLKVILFDKQETTEAGKLFLTEYYRICIEFAQKVKRYCDKNNLSFHETYTLPNQIYNSGYEELGHKEFVRPILQPIMTPIGGHCVSQNKELIKYE